MKLHNPTDAKESNNLLKKHKKKKWILRFNETGGIFTSFKKRKRNVKKK